MKKPLRNLSSTEIPRTSLSPNDLALLRLRNAVIGAGKRRPSKILVKVVVEKSLGPVQVVMSSEETVGNLIKRVLEIYKDEKRRPFLPAIDPRRFELHYSQFCLECLEENEKLINLESRDFFLCSKSKQNNNIMMSATSCCDNNMDRLILHSSFGVNYDSFFGVYDLTGLIMLD